MPPPSSSSGSHPLVLPISHIVEPSLLYVTWQSPNESAPDRLRRTIATVSVQDGEVRFRYLTESPEFLAAKAGGFQGFPAFAISDRETRIGVLESLSRRLPSRRRDDFSAFLSQHHLPVNWPYSDLALLAYTGGKLPSDGFSFVPCFPANAVPCDYITEVAGPRHVFAGDPSSIRPGDAVELIRDPDNPIEASAIYVRWNGQRLGFLNRALLTTVHRWLEQHQVTARVDRINGRPSRPLVYVRIEVR